MKYFLGQDGPSLCHCLNNHDPTSPVRHRRDIDGLRGLAVLLVVAYHAGLSWMQGGFIGVDVFFVVSGYLITGILEPQFSAGGVRILEFYTRRLRRILPAMLVVLSATLAAGLFILGPFDLVQLATAVVAVMCLGANFYFWHQRDYFADQAPPHALLHTWSLGVEEQFYLLFPLLLLPFRSSAKSRLRLILLCFSASLICSVWVTASHPAAAFYLMPSRAWELCLGALVALLGRPISPRSGGWLGGLGLALILSAAVALSGSTPYPGVAAFLPATGAALLIVANAGEGTLIGRLMCSPWLRRIGLASYSIYLWHWPILTLYKHWLGRGLSGIELGLALLAIALISAFSWRYVELRFRQRATPHLTTISLRWIGLLASVLLPCALLTIALAGFPSRLPASARALDRSAQAAQGGPEQCHRGVADFSAGKVLCPRSIGTGPRILLWGDSHANALSPMLVDQANARHASLWQATYSSCPPLLGVDVAHTPSGHHCAKFNQNVLESVWHLGIKRVVLAGYWNYYASPRPTTGLARMLDPYSSAGSLGSSNVAGNQQIFATSLAATVRALRSLDVEVWVVDQVPVQREYVPDMIGREARRDGNLESIGISTAAFTQDRQFVHGQLLGFGASVNVIDPAVPLCATGVCVCFASGQALYIDSHHLSPAGSRFIADAFVPLFHR